MSNSEARTLPYFTDTSGRPLESGKIYIGQPGLDPIANPQDVYSDAANTVALAQPIRTVHGHAVSAGQYVHLFCTTPYSITITDSSGRVTYTSLNESDPTSTGLGKTMPQSASDLADLRARSGASTNQVFVTGYGMYFYDSTDTTSPEDIPRVIVGSDGSRYKLSAEYIVGGWLQASSAGEPTVAGAHLSFNDDSTSGAAFLSANRGALPGGIVLRVMSADGLTELGRATVSASGGVGATTINASGAITGGTQITAVGNLMAQGGAVHLKSDSSRPLYYDGTNYNLLGAPLFVNGSHAMTVADSLSLGVGALAFATTPPATGVWQSLGTVGSGTLYIRTA